MQLLKKISKRLLGDGERTKGVLSGSMVMVISSFVGTLTRVGLIAILARIYSKEQFGIWVTITSATAIMATSDFGIGNALRNKLSQLRVKGDPKSDDEAREYFLSVIYFFLFIALAISLFLIFFHDHIPYYKVFKTDNAALKQEGVNILLAVQVIFLLSIPLGIGSSMFFAYMEATWVATFNILNGIATLVAIGILASMGKSITVASVLFFLFSLIISIAGTLYFLHRRKWKFFQIRVKMILPRVWGLLALSFKFAILQFASVFMYNATTLVVTAKISLTDGAELNLVQKLYTFIIAIYLSLYNPLWAGYSDAIYRNDWDWSKKTLKRTILATTILFVTALFVFSFSGNFFLNLLAGKGYVSQSVLFILMGFWALFYCLYSMGVAFISATGKINLITALTASGAMFFVSIALFFSEKWGIVGISIWSALSFFLLGCAANYHAFFIIRKAKNKLVVPELV